MLTAHPNAGHLTDRSGSLRAAVLCLVGALISAAVPFSENAHVYAMVSILLFLVVGPVWFDWSRGRLDWFSMLNIVGAVSFAYFGLGAIWTIQDPTFVAYDRYAVKYIPQALFYCLLGYLALLAGYYGFQRGPGKVRAAGDSVASILFVMIPGGLGFLGYLARTRLMSGAQGAAVNVLGSTLSQLVPLFVFAWGLAWLLFFGNRRVRWLRVALFGFFIPATALLVLLTSHKSLIASLMGVPLVAWWYTRRRMPWVPLATVALLVVFIVFPFYTTFRAIDPTMSQGDRLGATVRDINSWDSQTFIRSSVGSFKTRLALINSVAVVIRDVGRWVPYARGETIYGPTLAFFVPRFLWPDKPTFQLGREFGKKFRIVGMLDRTTSISSTVPGELYWNFDLPGIIIGMALWGILIRFLYRRYGLQAPSDLVRRAIYIVLLVQLAHMGEGHVAGHLVGISRILILLEGYRWLSRRTGLLEMLPSPPAAGSR